MSRRLTRADLGYVAALLDQHARLTLRAYRGTQLPELIVQGRIAALPWLAEVTGSKVIDIPKGYNRHQCSEHCKDAHTRIESVTQRWSVTGARATILLYNVEPYMRVQGADARRLMAAGAQIGYKRTVVEEMRGLDWEIPELREEAWAPVERAS
jgi:hypothetical protein